MICGFLQATILLLQGKILATLTALESAAVAALEVWFLQENKVGNLGVLFCYKFLIFNDTKLGAYGLDK